MIIYSKLYFKIKILGAEKEFLYLCKKLFISYAS